jgi:hypothetical protein
MAGNRNKTEHCRDEYKPCCYEGNGSRRRSEIAAFFAAPHGSDLAESAYSEAGNDDLAAPCHPHE